MIFIERYTVNKFIKNLMINLINKFNLKIKNSGVNNKIIVGNNVTIKKTRIKIYGNDNTIIIGDNTYLHNVRVNIGFSDSKTDKTTLTIGKYTTINSAIFQLGENNSTISIGEDCMLSFNIEMSCSDIHIVYDENGKVSNIGKIISIGNHIWLGKNVCVLKNTTIPDGCIVGQNSIVTKKFQEKNSVLAGNPAKIVKNNCCWSRLRPNNHTKER